MTAGAWMWTLRALSEEREMKVYFWCGEQANSPSLITSHSCEGTTRAHQLPTLLSAQGLEEQGPR